jgi:DNA-binding GntR family transcriptional regulator
MTDSRDALDRNSVQGTAVNRAITQPEYHTLEDYAYQTLRRAVVRGELPVGRAITLQELEKQMGVSRTPIRQAIRRLAEGGFVAILPNRSLRVEELRIEDAHELYSIRRLMEGFAIAESIRRMSDADRALVLATLDESENSYARDDPWQVLSANRAFHRALYGACGLPRLIAMIDDLVEQCERYRWTELAAALDIEESRAQHRELARAAVAGEVHTAEEVLREHLELAESDVTETLARRKEANDDDL